MRTIKPQFAKFQEHELRVNITIVYEHTVCATSAFSMCMLRVAFDVVLFCFLNDVASCRILFCLFLHN